MVNRFLWKISGLVAIVLLAVLLLGPGELVRLGPGLLPEASVEREAVAPILRSASVQLDEMTDKFEDRSASGPSRPLSKEDADELGFDARAVGHTLMALGEAPMSDLSWSYVDSVLDRLRNLRVAGEAVSYRFTSNELALATSEIDGAYQLVANGTGAPQDDRPVRSGSIAIETGSWIGLACVILMIVSAMAAYFLWSLKHGASERAAAVEPHRPAEDDRAKTSELETLLAKIALHPGSTYRPSNGAGRRA